MENPDQNSINLKGQPAENTTGLQNNNSSSFAEKQPLIDPKMLALMKKTAIGLGIFALLFIIGTIVYMSMPKQTQIATIDTTTDDNQLDTLPSEERKYFAYIKDAKAIWIADTKGENKQVVLELATSSKEVLSTLTWKAPNEITYVVCAGASSSPCEVKTININSKSIFDEFTSTQVIKKIMWDKTSTFLAYIEDGMGSVIDKSITVNFMLKTGTIISTFNSFPKDEDPGNTKSQILFSKDNKYVSYYSVMKRNLGTKEDPIIQIVPLIEVYLLNGTKVDQIENASDPFFISENKLGYIKDNAIIYKTVGLEDETIATGFNGSNPAISPDKNLIAYWYSEGNLNNVVLGVFDTNLNIHRNLLRGIVLPVWISDSQILGIKADNCLQGTSCQLYQFQTNSISLVDIQRGNVVQIDQGKRISEPSFVFFEDKNAD